MNQPSQPNVQNSKRKVALYVRVSTNDQKTGMESQIRALREFCERNKIENIEIFADEGISGAKISRPSLDRMMTAAKNGELERIIVYSFSRFARSTTHLLAALEDFGKLKISFTSLTEQIDTNSPMGKAFFTVIAAISQLERELICERVKNGLRNAKLKGVHIGRKKTRNSALIRALLSKGVPYRMIASITGSSHGSVYSEVKSLRKEVEEKKIADAQLEATGGLQFSDAKIEAAVAAATIAASSSEAPTAAPEVPATPIVPVSPS